MKLILIILSSLFSLLSMAMQPDQKGDFYGQLYVAIENDDQCTVETLFKEPNIAWKIKHWLSKYDPNKCSTINVMSKGHALIHWAVRADNVEVLDALFDDKRTNVDIENAHGCTALGFAVAAGKVQATSLLLNHGANPNIIADKKHSELCNDHHTLLHSAIMYYSQFHTKRDNYYKVIGLLLLDSRTDPNVRDALGKTPLHYAVALHSEKIVELLLQNSKIDKNILDAEHKSAIHYAREIKDETIEALLV